MPCNFIYIYIYIYIYIWCTLHTVLVDEIEATSRLTFMLSNGTYIDFKV